MSVRATARRRLAGPLAAAGALVTALALAPASGATAGTTFTLNAPSPCYVGHCTVQLAYDPSQMAGPGEVAVDWAYDAGAGFVGDATQQCAPAVVPSPPTPCLLSSPTYATAGTHTVMIRVTDADPAGPAYGTLPLTVAALSAPPVYVPPPDPGYDDPEPTVPARRPTPTRPTRTPSKDADEAYALCRATPPGIRCQPGNGRQTAGGGEKVSHKGWPRVTGVFWQVMNNAGRKKTGGPANDELLGHHGSDTLNGLAGHDVLWGDWDPANNNTRQRDVLRGGAGNDFIYPSHGTSTVDAGPGKDYIWAFYGNGVIDCGPGYDTVRVRLNSAFKLRHCEVVGHFCQFGADGHGGCLKPGEKRSATVRRRAA